MVWSLIPNILINTLVLSAMYILATLGFAFVFNMLGIMNLAHGAVYMLGAYACFYISKTLGASNWLSMLFSVIGMGAFGLFLERFCFRPFMKKFSKTVMIGVALMTVFQTLITVTAGTQTLSIESFARGVTQLGKFSLSNEKILTFSIGVALLVVVLYLVYGTRFGRQMEAVSQDRMGAALMGININRISALVFGLACILATVSGSLMGAYQSLSPYMGDNILTRILMLVMLAGAGSMGGIFISGLILGFMDSLFPVVFSNTYASSACILLVVIVLLLFKPQGFFGHDA